MRKSGDIWNIMLETGAILPPHTPCASLVILVRKKDGKLWFCIDMRKLNAHTTNDSYNLTRIEDTLDSLNGALSFTALDLQSGYWQVKMDEASKPLMAFTVGLLGFYKCDSMPFRLVNAPATFQSDGDMFGWSSAQLVSHLSWQHHCVFKMPKDHPVWLGAVFQKLQEAGLQLKPSKCEFFYEITYILGTQNFRKVLQNWWQEN